MRNRIAVAAALCALAALLCCPGQALEASRYGLDLCARVIVPTLLPFFVLTVLLSELGLPKMLGRRLERPMRALFGVSGTGAAAFLLGVTGGYPLGAAAVAEAGRKTTSPGRKRKTCWASATTPARPSSSGRQAWGCSVPPARGCCCIFPM